MKLLNSNEEKWTKEQKQLGKNKIMEKLKKKETQSKYTKKLLDQCKSWNVPATSVDGLNDILKLNKSKSIKIVRTEISYYRDTHKSEIVYKSPSFQT